MYSRHRFPQKSLPEFRGRDEESCFCEGGFRRIVLEVYAANPHAIHVYEECGFTVYDRNDKDVFMEMTIGDGGNV